jgi:hypothetical protein
MPTFDEVVLMDILHSDGLGKAQENLMCSLLIDYAKDFYRDPANQAAFESWLNSKRETQSCHDNSPSDNF